MRRLIGSGACGLAVALCIATVMPGARAAAVSPRSRTAHHATVRDRGLQLQMQHLLASANPLNPHPPIKTPSTRRGVLRALAPRSLTCFVGAGACPLRPCVVPVTTARPGAPSGSCPTGTSRARPQLNQLVVSSSGATVVMRRTPSARILAPSERLSASP